MPFQTISDHKRLWALILLMVGISAITAGIGGWGLYQTALDEQRSWLLKLAQSQARIIESVARFDAKYSQQDHPEGAAAATISQIRDAYKNYGDYGDSGEFVLGQRDGDKIIFLDTSINRGTTRPQSIPFDSDKSEPMHHALHGHSGTLIGLDYRGVMVLAAYEPVAVLDIGIVAKIDLAEIRAPFIKVGIVGGFATFLIIVLGGLLTHRISSPLLEKLQLHAQILDQMSEGVLLVRSKDAAIVYTNPRLNDMFAYAPGELTGKNISILNAEGETSPQDTARDIIDALNAKGRWFGEVHNVRKDGTPLWCHAAVSSFDHPQFGEVWVSVHKDITARKLVEETLKRNKQELENYIVELDASRHDMERQADELAELVDMETVLNDKLKYEADVKDRFFSIISHDLKSPFNSLLGLTHMMSEMADSFSKEQLVDYAKLVNNSGDKLFELLENLLDWSRLQMEGADLQPAIIALGDLTQECIDILNPIAQEKDIQLITKVKKTMAFADRDMVLTVIRNLLTNAIKFTPSGGKITVSARKHDDMTQITVSDSGVGMTKQQIESVFALDQKTSTTGTAGEPGTGLGLPICKDMIERNGGRIWIESTPGEGSRFHFTLPGKLSKE